MENQKSFRRTGPKRIWKISAGHAGSAWKECVSDGCILLGYADDADYRQFPGIEDLEDGIIEGLIARTARKEGKKYNVGGWSTAAHAAKTIKRFRDEILVGDVVIGGLGNRQILGIDFITSEYLPPEQSPSSHLVYKQSRRVDWVAVDIVNASYSFSGTAPIQKIGPEKWDEIIKVVTRSNPQLAAELSHIFAVR